MIAVAAHISNQGIGLTLKDRAGLLKSRRNVALILAILCALILIANSLPGVLSQSARRPVARSQGVPPNLLDLTPSCTPTANADCQHANLAGSSLAGSDLSSVNLSGANLQNSDLQYADLSNANLSGADLRGVNLQNVNLAGADLTGANLAGAQLCGATLPDGNFVDADCSP